MADICTNDEPVSRRDSAGEGGSGKDPDRCSHRSSHQGRLPAAAAAGSAAAAAADSAPAPDAACWRRDLDLDGAIQAKHVVRDYSCDDGIRMRLMS